MKRSHTENTVGPWARQKLNGLEAYLDSYTTALSKQRFKLVYIDAFAGAGKSRIRGAWENADESDLLLLDEKFRKEESEFVEGSPRRALSLARPFSEYFFFDADNVRAQLLKELQDEYPDRQINIGIGDGNSLVQALLPSIDGPNTRGVAFLDPYGPHLRWSTVQALGTTKRFEVIINFPLGMAINRLITRSGDIPNNWRADLNACFGGDEWEKLVYSENRDLFGDTDRQKVDNAAERLLEYYATRLKDVFGHVATPSVVRNTRGSPIYYILWAGPHPLGRKIADYILRLGDRVSVPNDRKRR